LLFFDVLDSQNELECGYIRAREKRERERERERDIVFMLFDPMGS
jgi:hypothetical protein